ncbi:MAG: hypothetical protein HYX50_05310 [Chloroflexi bacterium]|nr:hypothetical protein [Chloroflexota bacterium]
MGPLIVAVTDLLFQSRITAAARALGADVRVPTSAERVALTADAALVVDLQDTAFDPAALIAAATAAGVPTLAFGRHTEVAALRMAREAGAAAVVPRSQLAEELPALLAALLRETPAGGRPA